MDTFIKTCRSGFLGQMLKLSFKLFPFRRFHNKLIFALLPLFIGRYKAEAQYLEASGAPYSTLFPIYRKMEFVA